MDTGNTGSAPAAEAAQVAAPAAAEVYEIDGVRIEMPAGGNGEPRIVDGEPSGEAPAAEAKPAEAKEEPKAEAKDKPRKASSEWAALRREQRAFKAERAAAAAEAAKRDAEIKPVIERATKFEAAAKARDIDALLEAAGVAFEDVIEHFASKGKEPTPEELTKREIDAVKRKLEEQEAEKKADAERKAEAEKQAAKERYERELSAQVQHVTEIAKGAGFARLPRDAAERAIAIVHAHWVELGKPDVPLEEYDAALAAALPRVEAEFEERGFLLPKVQKTPASPPSEAKPATQQNGDAGDESPRTLSSSMTGSPPPLSAGASLPQGDSHEDVLKWAMQATQR